MPAEVEQPIAPKRAADEPSKPLLIERRRLVEEHRVPVRVVASGERRRCRSCRRGRIRRRGRRSCSAPLRVITLSTPAGRLTVLRRERIGQHLKFLNPVLRELVRLPAVELHLVRRAVDDDAVGERPLPGDRHPGALAGPGRRRGVAPGAMIASALKFRAMVGRSSICLLLTIVANVLCVSTATLCPTTSTASATPPSRIATFTVRS